MQRLLICTAIELERRAIARALSALQSLPFDVTLSTIGIRAARLPEEIDSRINCIMLAGLAGGLDPRLKVGDLVMEVPNGVNWKVPNVGVLAEAAYGPIHCAANVVSTVEAKAALFRSTNALAVEMEGNAVRALAARVGVPLLHLRCISDAADDKIDPELLGVVDNIGRLRPLRLARYLVRHPGRIPALRRLGDVSGTAADRLGSAILELVPLVSALTASFEPL